MHSVLKRTAGGVIDAIGYEGESEEGIWVHANGWVAVAIEWDGGAGRFAVRVYDPDEDEPVFEFNNTYQNESEDG